MTQTRLLVVKVCLAHTSRGRGRVLYRKKLTHSSRCESHCCNHTNQLSKQRQESRKRKLVLSLCLGWMLPRGRDAPWLPPVSHRLCTGAKGRRRTTQTGEHLVLSSGWLTSGQIATIKNKAVCWSVNCLIRLMNDFPLENQRFLILIGFVKCVSQKPPTL